MVFPKHSSPIGSKGTFKGFATELAPNIEDLNKCVHCGFCLQVCPTYLETGHEAESPRGRLALMKAVSDGRLEVTDTVLSHWDSCLQCRACEVACPSGVPYGSLMEATQASVVKRHRKNPVRWLARQIGYRLILSSPRSIRVLGRVLRAYRGSILQRFMRTSRLIMLLPGNAKELDKSIPRIGEKFFLADGTIRHASGVKRAKAAMLAGCVMTVTHGAALDSAVRVLQRNGVEVHLVADQGCCGALNVHSGEKKSGLDMAIRNIDAFLRIEPDVIITASAGCGAMMKEYGELLADHPEYNRKAAKVSSLTKDIHEFLASISIKQPASPLGYTVTYQDACHMAHVQRIKDAPRLLLDSIPEMRRVEMKESDMCCGSAGTYSITQRSMSSRLGRRKARNIIASGADMVVTGNPGCAIQMENWLRELKSDIKVGYVAELLEEAYSQDEKK